MGIKKNKGMNIHELRIGNYIYQYTEIINIGSLQSNFYGVSINGSGIDTDIFTPIHLTEEWLLKFGFTVNHFDRNRFDEPNDGGNHYHVMPYKSHYVFRCAGCSLAEIHSIHQLQNLYFALTGDELCIKQ